MLKINQSQTDLKRIAYFAHGFLIQMGDLVSQPLLVNRPNLFQQDDRVAVKTMRRRINFHMRRQFCLLDLGSNRRYDYSRTKPVANIILDDQYRPYSSLLGTDNG